MKIKNIITRSKLTLPLLLIATVLVIVTVIIFIFEKNGESGYKNIFDAFWWSVVTISTTGYGQIVPVTIAGRIVALFTIMSGVLLTALLTGTIASSYLNNISRTRSGLMEFKKIKDHIIICGWRGNMGEFLKNIVSESTLSLDNIIVVADAPQEMVDSVFESLQEFKFVRGSFFDKNILAKANVKQATKAVVLADQMNNKSGFEVDSQTVMTVISLKALNKNIYVSAQLLEKNFEIYLQRAKCDEIMYAKSLNNDILMQVIAQNGMSNIIAALFSNEGACRIRVESVKSSFINKTVQDIKTFVAENFSHSILLGILEHTGKQHEIKDQAIRQAQRTAQFPEMLKNLREVQNIKAYKPVMIPADDYIINRHSAMILLERKEHGKK